MLGRMIRLSLIYFNQQHFFFSLCVSFLFLFLLGTRRLRAPEEKGVGQK